MGFPSFARDWGPCCPWPSPWLGCDVHPVSSTRPRDALTAACEVGAHLEQGVAECVVSLRFKDPLSFLCLVLNVGDPRATPESQTKPLSNNSRALNGVKPVSLMWPLPSRQVPGTGSHGGLPTDTPRSRQGRALRVGPTGSGRTLWDTAGLGVGVLRSSPVLMSSQGAEH